MVEQCSGGKFNNQGEMGGIIQITEKHCSTHQKSSVETNEYPRIPTKKS